MGRDASATARAAAPTARCGRRVLDGHGGPWARLSVCWWSWCLALAFVLGVSPARAEAPMCDRVGACVDAPAELPPVNGCLSLAAALGPSADGDAAPMCDRSGVCIEAPVEVPFADGGRLEELPCEAERRELLERLSGASEPRQQASRELAVDPPRAVPACVLVLLAPPGELLEESISDGPGPLRGHSRPVYRPPLHA